MRVQSGLAWSFPLRVRWDRPQQTWPARRQGAFAMAGFLAFAAPLKFFVGFLSVAHQPDLADVAEMAAWWLLFGGVFWVGLLVSGEITGRVSPGASRLRRACVAVLLAFACGAAANLATFGRARVLIEQGVVQGVLPLQLYGIALSFTLALLFFMLLERTRSHERAAARLAAAKAAQREARRRFVQMDLQAVQARIDPGLLFDMLEAVKRAYVADPARAEHLLDELIAFLRACLPRIRAHASSVAREAELARAYVRLLSLAQCDEWVLRLDASSEALYARFPPGALLPLVDSALRVHGGNCTLRASCAGGLCRVALALPAAPALASLQRVEALLKETDGTLAGLSLKESAGAFLVTIEVPHEPA